MTKKKETDPQKKKPSKPFRDIEDVVSIGALLRPTIVQAVEALGNAQRAELKEILIGVERELSDSSRPFQARFAGAQERFRRTFDFSPIWRFIAMRLEDTWKEVEEPGVKELSIFSLLVGMLFEETSNRLAEKGAPARGSRKTA